MITRHNSELIAAISTKLMIYDKILPILLDNLQNASTDKLGNQVIEALSVFSFCIANDEEKEKTLKYLRLGRDFGVVNFMFGTHIDQEFSCVIDGREFNLKGEKSSAYMHTSIWLKAFYTSIILRTNNAIQSLSDTPEQVFLDANIKPSEFDLVFVKVLKGLFDVDAPISQNIIDALNASDPEKLNDDRQDYILKICVPALELLTKMLTNDEAGFNEALESALNDHKKYWSRYKDDSDGWISFPILAICSLVFDNKDLTISVESDYIPKWLYKKEF
jgi:hypothetical protein